jgi:hypothetical protein
LSSVRFGGEIEHAVPESKKAVCLNGPHLIGEFPPFDVAPIITAPVPIHSPTRIGCRGSR